MAYRGNKEYKLDHNLWLEITCDCQFEPRYSKEVMRYINKRRRQRDRRMIENCLKEYEL